MGENEEKNIAVEQASGPAASGAANKNAEPEAAARLAELEKSMAEANEKLENLNGSFKQAVASYRTLMVKSNPEVLPELLEGETIEALDKSLSRARELIGKVKSGLEAQAAAARIPAGAPQRAEPDPGSMSSREKIRWGLTKSQK
jgi:DNA anti-recombination protein RmuC